MPTKEELKRASKIAEKNMREHLKTLSGGRLEDLRRFGNAKIFDKRKKK